ncbi:MAG: hypothetical protein CL666_14020 [Balneola sp.]|nr:hypothetical protein [Balneola sp.]
MLFRPEGANPDRATEVEKSKDLELGLSYLYPLRRFLSCVYSFGFRIRKTQLEMTNSGGLFKQSNHSLSMEGQVQANSNTVEP